MTPQKWLVVPDLQWRLKGPGMDERAMSALLKYARDNYWYGCLQLGDAMDWDWLSKYTEADRKAQENQRWNKEYEGFNKFLDKFQAAIRHKNPDAKIVIIQGNHDWRVQNAINKNPSLEGSMEMELKLHFQDRKIEFWKYWEHKRPYKIGKALFIHGQYTNDAHAKKHALNYNKNLFYGHTHDRQLYSKTIMGKTIQAESLGTLSRYDLSYMGNKPSNWSQCFATFYFWPNGNFNHYVTNVINGEFYDPTGKQYKA